MVSGPLRSIGGSRARVYRALHVMGAAGVYRILVSSVVKSVSILAFMAVGALNCLANDAAQRLFEAGEHAARGGDNLQALLLYSQAARLDPSNAVYAQRRSALQKSALARPVPLTSDRAQETTESRLREEGILDTPELPTGPPPQLSPAPGRQT